MSWHTSSRTNAAPHQNDDMWSRGRSPDLVENSADTFHDVPGNGYQHNSDTQPDDFGQVNDASTNACYNCGQSGHRAAQYPDPREINCRYCKQLGHMVKDCPSKPALVCDNCGQEGHVKNMCENARKINRDNIASLLPDIAWEKLRQAVLDRDMDDAKEAIQEYVKSLDGAITYRELQEAMIDHDIHLYLIATERTLLNVFTNMDLQGNMGKKYSISYRFSEAPERPREAEFFPKDRNELLARLDDAGEVVNSGRSVCHNCGELGHISKNCTEARADKPEQPKILCSNCSEEGHRLRDCPQPRVDRFACKNCGQSGHKAAECDQPPNLDNIECRKCNERGHFSRDCPKGGSRACRNCGGEGHIAKECTEPLNLDMVTCRNCEKTGHFSRDCPEPKDWSKVQCSNCQEFGHTKVRCKQLPADNQGFDSQGFSNNAQDNAGDNGSGEADMAWGSGADGGAVNDDTSNTTWASPW